MQELYVGSGWSDGNGPHGQVVRLDRELGDGIYRRTGTRGDRILATFHGEGAKTKAAEMADRLNLYAARIKHDLCDCHCTAHTMCHACSLRRDPKAVLAWLEALESEHVNASLSAPPDQTTVRLPTEKMPESVVRSIQELAKEDGALRASKAATEERLEKAYAEADRHRAEMKHLKDHLVEAQRTLGAVVGIGSRILGPAAVTPYQTASQVADAMADLIKHHRAERDEDDALRLEMSSNLIAIAKALKGDPGPLKGHDWSDLPAVAQRMMEEKRVTAERYHQACADRNEQHEDLRRKRLTIENLHEAVRVRNNELDELRDKLAKAAHPVSLTCTGGAKVADALEGLVERLDRLNPASITIEDADGGSETRPAVLQQRARSEPRRTVVAEGARVAVGVPEGWASVYLAESGKGSICPGDVIRFGGGDGQLFTVTHGVSDVLNGGRVFFKPQVKRAIEPGAEVIVQVPWVEMRQGVTARTSRSIVVPVTLTIDGERVLDTCVTVTPPQDARR